MNQAWIDEMAALWFVKKQDGLEVKEENVFNNWLQANEEHQKAYAQFEVLWKELGHLKSSHYACKKKKIKPIWAYACAVAVIFLGIGIFQWHTFTNRLEFAHTMVTPIGMMREYTLNDGTTLYLDTDTHVSVAYYPHQRLVTLHQGQIVLHVSKDTQRPLWVDTKNVQVRVTGTRFEVRHVDENVRVSVEEGSVDIFYKRPQDKSTLKLASLHEKEQILLDERGFVQAHTYLHNDSVAPWRGGRLVFDKTPLKDIVKEFQRYGVEQISIKNSQIALMTLSGSFEIERFASFIELLPRVLPAKVIHDKNQIVIDKK